MKIEKIEKCRVCGNNDLLKVIDLGPQFLQGSFIKPGKEMPPLDKIDCSILWCDKETNENACGLLQMEHSVPSEILYDAYWYRSGTNNTMRNHLKSIVDSILDFTILDKSKVLDVGCNDGTLLSNYPKNFEKYGCDPSDVAQEVKNARVVQDIFPSESLDLLLEGNKLDVITSIAMFYDLPNPIEFVQNIKKHLTSNGLWVFEMSYMPTMLELDSYDTICHEHLEYYSLEVLNTICRNAGMKIVKISFNAINGGSIQCFATHIENNNFESKENEELISKVLDKEKQLGLNTRTPYVNFQKRIESISIELHELISKLKSEGKKIHIYGASTKGNTILQWCNIDKNLIDFAAERNPDKFGAMTLGTEIPIISEEDSRAMNPDYYLVLPWHFKDEFVIREKSTLEKGTKFIFPLPKIEIL